MGFGGIENGRKGGAATRKPRLIEVLRERVEADIDIWLSPFSDALSALNTTGQPDHRTRMSAAEAVLDRVYGKPTQRAEVEVDDPQGRESAPLELEFARDVEEAFQAASIPPEIMERHDLLLAIPSGSGSCHKGVNARRASPDPTGRVDKS